MSKVKMRCITCGKWFQSANAKEVTCPDCTQKARKEKMATKNAPPTANKPGGGATPVPRPVVPPPPKPKPVQSGTAHWLDTLQDVKVAEPDPLPTHPKPSASPTSKDDRSGPGGYRSPGGLAGYREDRERGSNYEGRGPGAYREDRERTPGGYRVGGGSGLPGSTLGQKPRQPMEGAPPRGPRPDRPYPSGPRPVGGNQKPRGKGKSGVRKPAAPPKPKREKIPPPLPFVPTPEQITQVEERYLELATPLEFDGIRTQIAHELGIPKKAVKKIIKDLRARQDIPSWWELQTYKGPAEELERIKAAYLPLLPVPEVGVHKEIAEKLDIKPGIVYQAIKAIRLEMNLPQYNDPILHGPDFVLHKKKEKQPKQVEQPAAEATTAQDAVKDAEVPTPTPEHPDATTEAVSVTKDSSSVAKDAEATNPTPEAKDVTSENPDATTEVVPVTKDPSSVVKDAEAPTPTSENTDTMLENADVTSEAVPTTEGASEA